MSFENKVALVTGASRGIGAAIARALGSRGVNVAVNYMRNAQAADEVVKAIEADGGCAISVKADVRQAEPVEQMVARTIKELGPIDILILNAGAEVPFKAFVELSYSEFEGKVMGELAGFFHPLQAVLPGMIERRTGCIIGISSGLSRYPGFGFSAHTTAKSAVDGLMKSIAFELGPVGIRANTVAPGLTLTDATSWLSKEQIGAISAATPMKRVARPEDIAGAVMGLVSDDAGFVTGAYVPVSGGALMP